jgi:hypothetical protein
MYAEFEIRAIDSAGTIIWRELFQGDEPSAVAKGADVAATFTAKRREAVTEVSRGGSGTTIAWFEPGWT